MKNIKTIAWIVIILCVIVLTAMLATGVLEINLNPKSPTTLSKDKQTEENNKDSSTKTNEEEIYSTIIEEYKSAMNDKEYNNNSNNEEKYPNINNNIMHFYHNQEEATAKENMSFKYTYYDINKDNKNELIVTNNNTDLNNIIIEIYTYNGTKPIRFLENDCLGERCSAEIYENGIIYFYGSSGAKLHGLDFYKIASNGYSKESLGSYEVEYDENNKAKISIEKKETNFTSDEEVIKNVVGESNQLDLSKLSWTEIK